MFEPAFRPWLYIAGSGALVLLAALAALFVQLWVSIRERDANRVTVGDPWDGRGLEWSTSEPPPEYNYAVIPQIHGRDPFYAGKRRGDFYTRPAHYHDIEMPKNSMTGPVIGTLGAATALGVVWHIWWVAILGVLAIVVTVIARSFARDVHRIIPAAEVAWTDMMWLNAVADATPIPRQIETTSAKQGLAEIATLARPHERERGSPFGPQSRRHRRGDARTGGERGLRLLGATR